VPKSEFMAKPFLNASKFFEVAKKGFIGGQYNPFAKAIKLGGQYDALVAITFSVMTVEAFLGELIALSRDREESDAQSLANSIRERMSIEEKLFNASCITSDTPLVKGIGTYQDFKLLVQIRDAIVHPWAGDTIDDGLIERHAKILRQLRSRRISSVKQSVSIHKEDEDFTKEAEDDQTIDLMCLPFISSVATEDVAKWSYKVVSNVIVSFVDNMRESPFKNCLKDYTNGRFQEPSQNDLDELFELGKIFLKFNCWTSDDFLAKIRKKELIVSIPTDV
jgi:hypothetical protein